MSATVSVTCGKAATKDTKDQKDGTKETKDTKEQRKERIKESKEFSKDRKDRKDRVELKPRKELFERPFSRTQGAPSAVSGSVGEADALAALEARVAALEDIVLRGGAGSEPFIGSELRPDLQGGGDYSEPSDLESRMARGDRDAKLSFDTLPPA